MPSIHAGHYFCSVKKRGLNDGKSPIYPRSHKNTHLGSRSVPSRAMMAIVVPSEDDTSEGIPELSETFVIAS
jgi:hypothetical protein